MRGSRTHLLAATVAAAALLGGCSAEENPELIPDRNAQALIAELNQLEQAVADGQCDVAQQDLAAARNEVDTLPGAVDDDLVARLRQGLDVLEQRVPEDCAAAAETPTPTPEPTETPEPTPTPEPTETPAPTPAETPTPDSDGNGNGNGGNGGNGGGNGGEGENR